MVSKAMIMAAGVGSRLDPLTANVPKPLIPIANIPMMDILLKRLSDVLIHDVVANTHYMAENIIERYKKNNLGINFSYVHEEELSGTAGGVKKCQFFFDEGEDFLVLSADGLSNVDLKKAIESHKKSGAIVSMGIKTIPESEIPKFGVVVTDEDGFVSEFQEKPSIEEAKSNCVNTGIYVFNYKIFEFIPENTFYDFGKNVFPELLAKQIKINTFQVEAYWSDIGTIEQYAQSVKDLFENKYEINHSGIIKTSSGAYIKGESHIDPSISFVGYNTIGNDCIIGKNTIIKNCILWDGVELGENLILSNCILASNAKIYKNIDSQIVGLNQIIE